MIWFGYAVITSKYSLLGLPKLKNNFIPQKPFYQEIHTSVIDLIEKA